MKRTPLQFAFVYFLMGVLFTYLSIQSAKDTIWNFFTIVLAMLATLDFGAAIRLFAFHFRNKPPV
jgi:VanZ family protein